MEVGLLPTLNNQLLRLDRTYGANSLAFDFVAALHETLIRYEGSKKPVELMIELLHLYDMLLACRPRMASLILDIQKIVFFIHENPDSSTERILRKMLQIQILKKVREKKAIRAAAKLFDKPQSLLVHSLSGNILGLLEHLRESPNRPRVILAGQEPEKTKKIIKHLHDWGYDFKVVSEYAISHVREQIDLSIFGGLTLNDTSQVIMGPGSGSLIAQLAHYNIAIYVMMTVNKFSYWKEPLAPAFREVREKVYEERRYEKDVYSHDIVPLDLFSGLISQRSVLTPDEARKLLLAGQEEFFRQESIIRNLQDTQA